MSWLNFNLVPYIAKTRILPDTQVTTQQGVQTRDLMSYLAGIKCWAKRHKVEVFALKRDQMKGFDYLSPQGMYDAVNAYGLPSAIIDLDRAAQTDTRCFIQTAHGLTEPITISGVTKQGGSLSPVKSTLTTSLGHHYLNDLISTDPDALVITSGSAQKADPHLPDDLMQTTIVMTEATDDSYIFARTLASLRRSTLAMERFHKPAKLNDPQARYKELKHFIDDFTLPRFLRRAPITLLRKIVKQNIISKARTLLSLQPIKRVDAEDLNKRIKGKIHLELRMPFMPNSDILTLPVDLHGLDFPSIAHINDAIAIDGLHRDLNHPIPSYQILARITLADWTCTINNCVNPIDTDGLTRDFTRHANRIPHGWIIAQKAMSESKPKLSLKCTDLRGILNGDVSLSHVLNTFSNYSPTASCPNGHALKSLHSKGIRRLRDMGDWRLQFNGVWLVDVKAPPPTLPACVFDPKLVTAALTGPKTLVLKLEGCNVSILHGELVGLIMCLIISDPNDADTSLYSDHLNAVRLIEDSKTAIIYTPGHASEVSVPAQMNREADHYASSAQRHLRDVFTAPIPTFFMDKFTFFTRADGWIESNIRTYIDKSQIVEASKRIAVGHQQRMALHLYDTKAPPEYSYTTAYSAYSAVVQLYARSGQLPTADLLYSRGKAHNPRCRMGCNAIEDQHHIFVECEQYTEWRSKAAVDVHRRTESKLKEKGYEETDAVDLLSTAKFLFSDKPHIWPLQYCTYFLGHLPNLDHLMPKKPGVDDDKLSRTRLAHHIASDWHTAAIRLAGRIWGDWQRKMAMKNDVRSWKT
ncbi:hypothetical protein B0H17DRAFT_916723 [Mycena rosella]|uniref:Uncharacterized protein n=1 Tax=Mycena rosella TaxID=1033263 RepID=A0AAD7MB86_MYCRO|nr:hypothetical protein B0H17DRAFT_916723 [Mycena rosella]